MEKEQSLLVTMRYMEEANNMLMKANNILKDMGDDEGSLMGQGILRNIIRLRDYIISKIELERIEKSKNKEKVEE